MRVVRGLQVNRSVVRQPPARQRTPGHQCNPVRQTLIERAIVKTIQPREAEFNLVRDELHGAGSLQGGHLGGPEVAHAELAGLAGFLQLAESFPDLRRIAEEIGPMQLIEVYRLHTQPFQGLFARSDNVFGTEVIAVRRIGIRVAFFRMPHLVAITMRCLMPDTSLSACPKMLSHTPSQ